MASSNGVLLKAIPKYGEKIDHQEHTPALLAVLLGKTFLDPEKQSTAEQKVHESLEGHPTKQKPALLSIPNVEQGDYGTDGTLTDIYKIAQKACDMQWPSILVLDALSDRQLRGQTRPGEAEAVTVLVIHLKPASEDQRPSPSVFYVRRLVLNRATQECLDSKLKNWKKLGEDEQNPGNVGRLSVSEILAKGLYLYDPLGPVFMDEKVFQDVAQTSAKALDAKPSLPAEMKQHVENFLGQDSPLSELTEAPAKISQERGRIDIISLVHLEADQIGEAQKRIREAAESANKTGSIQWNGEVLIHQWKPHLPANRRDVMRLINRYLDNNNKPYYAICAFLVKIPTSKEQSLVWAQWCFNDPILLQHGSVFEFLKQWTSRFDGGESSYALEQLSAGEQLPDSSVAERLLDPLAAVPPNMPPWRPAIQEHVIHSCPPVFYLTNKLSEEQNKAVLDELYTLGEIDDEEKEYCFVPWGRDEEGGVEDMWTLLKKAYNFRGRRGSSPAQAIFIDRDSPEDKQVILADHRYDIFFAPAKRQTTYHLSSYNSISKDFKGMDYGRLPGREATINW